MHVHKQNPPQSPLIPLLSLAFFDLLDLLFPPKRRIRYAHPGDFLVFFLLSLCKAHPTQLNEWIALYKEKIFSVAVQGDSLLPLSNSRSSRAVGWFELSSHPCLCHIVSVSANISILGTLTLAVGSSFS